MTEYEELKKDVAEIKVDMKHLMSQFQELMISRAVSEERATESSKKIDLLTLTVSNNYTSAVEFGQFKLGMQEKLKDANTEIARLDGWLTWILRLTTGGMIMALIAAVVRFKGGL
jgi:hypothetical protein